MKRLVMAVLTAVTSLCVTAATLYVDYENGTDAEESATFKTLAYAVGKANPNDEIVLAKGTHVLAGGNVTVGVPLTIRGEGENWETILVSDKTVRTFGFTKASADGSLLHNLTLAGSKSPEDNYSEIYLQPNCAMTVSNVVYRSVGANPTACTKSNLIYNEASPTFKNFWMTNCLLNAYGVYLRTGPHLFENCVFSNNRTTVAGNVFYAGWCTPVIRHCTFANNRLYSGAAFFVTSGYAAKLENSIVWGNISEDTGLENNTSVTIATTKTFKNVCTRPIDGWNGTGHVAQDPCVAADGYTVSLASSCRGAADPTCTTEFDILGTPRGAKPTIGAYEFVDDCPFTVTVTQTGTFGRLPDGVTVTATVTGDYTGELAYAWDYDGDGETDSTEASPTITEPGFYHPFVRVTDGAGKTTGAFTDDWLAVHNEGMQSFYVDYSAADDQNTGFSPEKAFKTLERAVSRDYVKDGDEVILSKGTHALSASVTVGKAVTVRGAGTKEETILVSASKSSPVRLQGSVDGVVYHTFTLAGSKSATTGEVGMNFGKGTVVSNLVVRSVGDNPEACSISQLLYCESNKAVFNDLWMTNCILNANLIYLRGAKSASNWVVAGNRTTAGDGRLVLVQYCQPVLENLTIVGNELFAGGSFYAFNNGSGPYLYNSLIWNNYVVSDGSRKLANVQCETKFTTAFHVNCTTPITDWPSDNISEDPQMQPDGLHFLSSSPCNHTGDPDHAPAFDIAGNPRGDRPSIGALEYVASKDLICSIRVTSDTVVYEPEVLTLACDIEGDYTEPVTYAWDFNGDGNVDSTEATPEISARGVYSPSVAIVDAAGLPASAKYNGEIGVHVPGAATYYVDNATGDNANDGLAPDRAWKTLGVAVGKTLVLAGDEIVLVKGQHPINAAVRIEKAVRVRGAGAPHETVLVSTDAAAHKIEIAVAGATLSDFTTAGCNTDTYKAVRLVLTAAGLVSNVVVTALGPNAKETGEGAVWCNHPGAVFTHLVITNCTYGMYALYTESDATFDNCLVAGNRYDPDATKTAGAMCAPVRSANATPVFRYFTVADNTTYNSSAVYFYGNGIEPTFMNGIVWNNTDGKTGAVCGIEMFGEKPKTSKITYNCVNVTNGLDGVGNIIDDPLFKDAAKGDYMLTIPSPCRDTGLNGAWSEGTTDLRGNPRRFGRRTDRGCFELPYGYGLSVIVR